jgi:hypothetical protein
LEDQRSKWFPHISTELVKSCRNPFSNPFFHVGARRFVDLRCAPRSVAFAPWGAAAPSSLRVVAGRRRSSLVVAGRVPRPRS